jgi:hypothetical protein
VTARPLRDAPARERRETVPAPAQKRSGHAGFGPQAVLALQQAAGNQAVARLLQRSTPEAPAPAAPAPAPPTDLLAAFEAKFPAAAAKIRSSPAALELVEQAKKKSAEFGGFSEQGPIVATYAYTVENRVYVPQAQTDPIRAVNDFLFELNNAMRADQLSQIHKDALAGTIDAKTYARRKVEVEVEGILATGAVWPSLKAGDAALDQYDKTFYTQLYEEFKSGTKTKDQVVVDVLGWRSITAASKTNEDYYMEQYEQLRSGR